MSPLLFPGRAPCPPCGGPTHLTHVVTRGALAGQGRCGHLVLGGDRLHRGFLGVQGRAWEQERNTSLQEAEEGRGKTRWRMGEEGAGEGRGGPPGGQPCPAQPGVQSRAQKDSTHGPEPCETGLTPVPRGCPARPGGPPTCPIPPDILPVLSAVTQGLGQQSSPTQQRLGHRGSIWPSRRWLARPQMAVPAADPSPTSSRPRLGPRGWAFGKNPPGDPQGQQAGG